MRGDQVIIHFTNLLDEPSSIHCHGIELNNQSDGTAVTQPPVMPGDSFTYKFRVTRPGVFWYHPHMKPGNQVFQGMYGAFIVGQPAEATLQTLGKLPPYANTATMVLSDITVAKAIGSNDTATFPAGPGVPWAGPGVFPGHSASPTPQELCECPMDLDGVLTGIPLGPGDVPNVMPPSTCGSTGDPCGISGTFSQSCRTNEGQHVLTNGLIPPGRAGSPDMPGTLDAGAMPIPIADGEGVRLRLINTAVTRYFRLRATNIQGGQIPLVRLGGECGLLDNARVDGGMLGSLNTKYAVGEIVLGPSDRADVVFTMGGNQGDVITLWTLDYQRTGDSSVNNWALVPSVPVAHFVVSGAGGTFGTIAGTALMTDPAINLPLEDITTPTAGGMLIDPVSLGLPGSSDPEIRLTTMGGPGIDGVKGTFDAGASGVVPHIASSRYARLGELLELKVTNETTAHHPFHQHGFSMQPVRIEDASTGSTLYTWPYHEFLDTIDIHPGTSLVYRLLLQDRPKNDGVTSGGALGRWVFHCHIFLHAHLGMISELVVLPRKVHPQQQSPSGFSQRPGG